MNLTWVVSILANYTLPANKLHITVSSQTTISLIFAFSMKAIFLSINLDGVACIEREERVVVKSVYHSVLGLIGCF